MNTEMQNNNKTSINVWDITPNGKIVGQKISIGINDSFYIFLKNYTLMITIVKKTPVRKKIYIFKKNHLGR
jgi:hypothetical protein